MKQERDDPRFTAWLLGEATANEASAWERAIRDDEDLRREWVEQQAFVENIQRTMAGSVPMLDLAQRDQVMSLARSKDLSNKPATATRRTGIRLLPWSLAAAALAVMGVWLGSQYPATFHAGSLSYQQVTREISLLPADDGGFPGNAVNASSQATVVGGGRLQAQRDEMWQRQPAEFLRLMAQRVAAEPLPAAGDLPPPVERQWNDAAIKPIAPLPMKIGVSSWQWAMRSTLENGERPAPSLVRVEEWIQAFPMRRGLENEDQGVKLSATILSPGPFVSSPLAMVLCVTNTSSEGKMLSWQYHAPARAKYRLVGFDSSASPSASSSRMMAAGESLQVMIELDASADAAALGELRCQRAGQEMALSLKATDVGREDAEFYRLLVMMAAKLRGQNVDLRTLEQSIQLLENVVLDAQRAEAVTIMKRWL